MNAESELVRRSVTGDAEAFGQVAEACRPWLRGLCFRLVRDPSVVEDLVQEALLLAFRDLPHLRDPDLFRPWLSQTARNVCRMHLRRRRARPETLAADPPALAASPPPEPGWLLAALDEAARQVIHLHYEEGRTVGEVAAALSLTPAAVRSRLYRARLRLRKEMLAMTVSQSAWRLRTILLVEPNAAIQEPMVEGLTAAGYKVVVLPTGEAAIEAVEGERGQLLILDKHCVTPHWLEVMGLVLTDPYGMKNVPICTLVDPESDRDLKLAWHAGAQVCLTRPPSLDRLLNYVRHIGETWGGGSRPGTDSER